MENNENVPAVLQKPMYTVEAPAPIHYNTSAATLYHGTNCNFTINPYLPYLYPGPVIPAAFSFPEKDNYYQNIPNRPLTEENLDKIHQELPLMKSVSNVLSQENHTGSPISLKDNRFCSTTFPQQKIDGYALPFITPAVDVAMRMIEKNLISSAIWPEKLAPDTMAFAEERVGFSTAEQQKLAFDAPLLRNENLDSIRMPQQKPVLDTVSSPAKITASTMLPTNQRLYYSIDLSQETPVSRMTHNSLPPASIKPLILPEYYFSGKRNEHRDIPNWQSTNFFEGENPEKNKSILNEWGDRNDQDRSFTNSDVNTRGFLMSPKDTLHATASSQRNSASDFLSPKELTMNSFALEKEKLDLIYLAQQKLSAEMSSSKQKRLDLNASTPKKHGIDDLPSTKAQLDLTATPKQKLAAGDMILTKEIPESNAGLNPLSQQNFLHKDILSTKKGLNSSTLSSSAMPVTNSRLTSNMLSPQKLPASSMPIAMNRQNSIVLPHHQLLVHSTVNRQNSTVLPQQQLGVHIKSSAKKRRAAKFYTQSEKVLRSSTKCQNIIQAPCVNSETRSKNKRGRPPKVPKKPLWTSTISQNNISEVSPTTSKLHLSTSTSKLDLSTFNLDLSTSNLDLSTSNSDLSTSNLDLSTSNLDLSTSNLDLSTSNLDLSTSKIYQHLSTSTSKLDLSTSTSKLDSPTSGHKLDSPTSGHKLDLSTSTSKLDSPTSEHKLDSPTSEHKLDSPTSGHKLDSPTSGHKLDSPTSGYKLDSPTSEHELDLPTTETYWSPVKNLDVDNKSPTKTTTGKYSKKIEVTVESSTEELLGSSIKKRHVSKENSVMSVVKDATMEPLNGRFPNSSANDKSNESAKSSERRLVNSPNGKFETHNLLAASAELEESQGDSSDENSVAYKEKSKKFYRGFATLISEELSELDWDSASYAINAIVEILYKARSGIPNDIDCYSSDST
ncbi:hypothetical protein CDAR_470861 [Caerostris darwini]|uniref:Uncharacterized protein n=1 Tax=Caerostris darwini TaxID=1538125 RepID=A0AAV4VGB0_9ARAC|nr:hypothetical protein CDAR_470861 [Caerostris darwini]